MFVIAGGPGIKNSVTRMRPWRQTGQSRKDVPVSSSAIILRRRRCIRSHLGRRHAQEVLTAGELLLPIAVAEEAVVANALEAERQDVEQKAPDEFRGSEGHRFLAVPVQMRMRKQVLPPGVQDGEEPDLRAQVLGIGRDDA